MSRLSIPSMLNDAPPSRAPRALHPPPHVDASSDLRSLLGAVSRIQPHTAWSSVSPTSPSPSQVAAGSLGPSHSAVPGGRTAEYGVHVSPRSHLSVLYRYQPGVDLEYPESGANAPVGHLIPMDPAAKQLPWVDFAYSRGTPDGGCAKDDFFFSDLLVDANGKPVPCKKRHTTCQGVKACPFSDTQALTGPAHCHTSATRQDIENRLTAARDARQRLSTPSATFLSRQLREELLQFEQEQSQQEHFRRGYSTPQTCQGRIRYHEYPDPFDKDAGLRAYLSCEHYSRRTPDHWTDFSIQDGGYDVDYIAAHFLSNTDELQRIEQAAATQDLGPLAFCNTLRNFSAQTPFSVASTSRIFQEINQIVHHDTGRPLYWRHIHGRSPNDFRVGLILHWGADQHRGQAKGLGLHLADRASELPLNTMDMHEPDRSLHDLTPYDHLRRVYRVCRVHNFRNIQHCAVPAHVRRLMRSLACIKHPDWQGTIALILRDGGKAAADWVRDKESCQFAFSGICWERSFIPLPIWEAGDPHTNLIETVHRDVNREGVHCTLLGGLLRGQDYDELQRATLLTVVHAVNPVTNAIKNVIRRDNGQAKKVQSTALAVSTHNSNMQKFDEKLREALGRFDKLKALINAPHLQASGAQAEVERQLRAASNAARTVSVKYDKQVQVGVGLRAAGCHGVCLPSY
ncbi:hypothetical protein B0H13DRAFT_1899728 [Mycena leptocephala]|nr:hypothetical protein B0H13DRAFT_1899728 [Mycena leptocephala]